MRFVHVGFLIAAVAVTGCGDKSKDMKASSSASNKPAASAAKTAGTTAATTAAATGDAPKGAVDWEKVERVPFAKLQGLIPENAGGIKRTNLTGQTVPDGAATYSEATGEFNGEGDEPPNFRIVIQDHPFEAEQQLPNKTTAYKDYPVFGESEDDNESDLKIIVANRFIVHLHGGGKKKVADLKAILDKMDLAKLASWKSEGIPK